MIKYDKKIIGQALREDIKRGDVTTKLLIPKAININAEIMAKESGVIAGLSIARDVFKAVDKKIRFNPLVKDGSFVKRNKIIAQVKGNAQNILMAERTALNFLGHLSGVATLTRKFVEKVKPYQVKIMDTRKTTPCLRILEKYAVRCGGGVNHRMGLWDMVLIKDNHLQTIDHRPPWPTSHKSQGRQTIDLKKIIDQIRKNNPRKIKIEVEVKNLREFKEALKAKPDIIMLDNMTLSNIKKAVKIRDQRPKTKDQRPKLEASGGINLKNVRDVARTGVDMISIGALTHSVKSIDLSLEVQ